MLRFKRGFGKGLSVRITLISALMILTFGCEASGVFQKNSGEVQQKPAPAVQSNVTDPTSAIAKATYEIHVKTVSIELCGGEAQATINSDFTLTLPEAYLKCMGIKVDLTSMVGDMLGKQGAVTATQDDPIKGIVIDSNGIIRLKKVGTTAFDPARAMMVMPLVKDPTQYQNIDETKDYKATAEDGTIGTGQIGFKVIGVNETFKPENNPDTYSKIVHIQMTAQGFTEMTSQQRMKAALIQRVELMFNMAPIAIPKVVVEGATKDMIDTNMISGSLGGTAGGILSGITGDIASLAPKFLGDTLQVELILKSQELMK